MLLAEHIKDLTVFWIAGDVLRRGEVGEEAQGFKPAGLGP